MHASLYWLTQRAHALALESRSRSRSRTHAAAAAAARAAPSRKLIAAGGNKYAQYAAAREEGPPD